MEVLPRSIGRPTKYCPNFCQEIIKFFDRPLFEEKEIDIEIKGRWFKRIVQVPCRLPTVEGFALSLGVHFDTLYEWAKVHPDFSEALRIAKQAQKEILLYHALTGGYKENFSKFLAINCTDMRDKIEDRENEEARGQLKLAYKI